MGKILGKINTDTNASRGNIKFSHSSNYNAGQVLDPYKQPVTFTFIDAIATAVLPFHLQGSGSPIIKLPGLSVLAISEHCDTYPVTSLGNKGIDGFTRGHALTAGSLGFTVFDRDPWWDIIAKFDQWVGNDVTRSITRPHNLPPFDIIISFANDKGQTADLVLRSVVILDGSQTMGVDTIKMTQAYSFICKGVTTFLSDTANGDFLQNAPSYAFDTKRITGNSLALKPTITTQIDPITGDIVGSGGVGNDDSGGSGGSGGSGSGGGTGGSGGTSGPGGPQIRPAPSAT